jgi:hypothetical protein
LASLFNRSLIVLWRAFDEKCRDPAKVLAVLSILLWRCFDAKCRDPAVVVEE